MGVCICDTCNCELETDDAYAIGPLGGIPTDPSPTAVGAAKVYRLLCRKDFIRLYVEHGYEATEAKLQKSHQVAVEHLRLTGRLGDEEPHRESCANVYSVRDRAYAQRLPSTSSGVILAVIAGVIAVGIGLIILGLVR